MKFSIDRLNQATTILTGTASSLLALVLNR